MGNDIKAKQGDSAEGLLEYQRRLKGAPDEQAGVRVFAKQGIHNVENAATVLDRLATKSGRKNAIVHFIIRRARARRPRMEYRDDRGIRGGGPVGS
jgi:hypothetical protein